MLFNDRVAHSRFVLTGRALIQVINPVVFADFVFDLWRQCVGHVTKVCVVGLHVLVHDGRAETH